MAADIASRPECEDALCWVYRTPRNLSEALEWAEKSLTVHKTAPSDEDLIPSIAETRLPYEPLHSLQQYVGFHLVIRPNGDHSFFIHGTHAIFDAQPNLHALRKVFDGFAIAADDAPLATIEWGEEVANLPIDLITALGKARCEDHGLSVPESLRTEKVCEYATDHMASRLTILSY